MHIIIAKEIKRDSKNLCLNKKNGEYFSLDIEMVGKRKRHTAHCMSIKEWKKKNNECSLKKILIALKIMLLMIVKFFFLAMWDNILMVFLSTFPFLISQH